ncbi:AAA family ATPase [Planomonospora sp. ID67723]|uniref:AfsR/SARP family transcriptional regulator n=1 Tax=Planomonospora sp. ID67723 TaxID=2738134 RepID=UPI0018C3FBF1|nr:AfsR/SARP family transcriptional regulator [Planomonospora sp. ID67723]MBG0831221.1 AAA family ATPase [Planomonospora sp. ID67723]
MKFRVLGPIEVYGDGVPVRLGGPRQRAVLARLLVAGGAVVSTGTLIEDLYGDASPPSAVATIQAYVSNLRRAIEPGRPPRALPRLLVGRPPGYLLVATDLDARRFTELVTRSESLPPEEALACSEAALRLWNGPPYGEFTGELWASSEVARLSELRLVAVERRARAQLDLGRPQAVVTSLEAESAAHPLRERLWHLLALALYRTGRQADALAVLRRAGRLLADQLGLDPGPGLRTLEEAILRQADSLMLPSAPAEAVPASPARPRAPHGRERQLAELETLPERGEVATAAVSGEPGIGKTWLLGAFRDRCATAGRPVLWGRCPETEGSPPLWPWLQLLRALTQVCPPPDRRALAGLLDDETPAGSTEAALLRRHQAIADWLRAAARSRPLVVILDDLHWADPASLRLLSDLVTLLADSAEPVPVTLVTAFRDGPDRLHLDDVLGRLARHDLLHIRLTGLGPETIKTIAHGMGVELDGPTARRLTERTGGNPLFARETTRMLAQGGTLGAVPVAVADLIRRRVAALGPQAVEALNASAVIGRQFDPGVVAQACRAAPAEVYGVLDQAAQAGLLVSCPPHMAFAHDLVREALLRDLPALRRAAVHREVMAALAARPGVDVAVIAHHAVEAGPAAYGEAARWARAAARQASLRLAYEEAALWWGRAVEAHGASAGDPLDHVDLLLHQVRALLAAGDALGARRARAQAIRVADRSDRASGRNDPMLTIRALTALDAPSVWTLRNPYEEVELHLVRRFETALSHLPPGDGADRVRLLGGLAQELYDGSDDPRCDLLSAEAVETARRLGDPHLLMQTLNARQLSLPQSVRSRELLEIATELLGLAARTRTPEVELLAQMLFTHHRLQLFDLAGADEAAARCDASLERLPLPWPRFQHTMWRAGRLVLEGCFDDADVLYGEAEQQAGRLGMWYAGAVVDTGRIMLHFHRGSMADAGALIDSIAGIHATMDNDARILHLCAQGRTAQARGLVEHGWRTPPRDWSWLTMTCLQAAAQTALGDVSACQASYSALLPHSGGISAGSAIALAGPVDWFLALLASALGERETAVRHLVTLARLAGRNGLVRWRDRAAAELGLIASEGRSAAPRRAG